MIASFRNNKVIQNLIHDAKHRPLVLFVGAGINVPMIPTWDNLLNEIMEKSIRMNIVSNNIEKEAYRNLISWHTSNALSVYEKASLIKILSEKQYLYLIEDALYKNINKPEPSRMFLRIKNLCSSENVHAVVSYNYDDYLLTEVKKFRNVVNCLDTAAKYQTDFDPGRNKSLDKMNHDLHFYFVHGFIPRKANYINNSNNIVLSYDEYFLNMLNPYSWQTATQIYFLKNYTCLFLGTSLSDWNMLRLIQYANDGNNSIYLLMSEQSFYKDGDPYVTSDYVKKNIIRTKATILDRFGVRLILTGTEYDTVAKTIDYIYENIT